MDSGIKKINTKEIDFSFDNWDTKHEYRYSNNKSNNIPVEEVELNLDTSIIDKYGNINYSKEIGQIGYRAQGITTINDKYVAISAYDFENAKTSSAGASAIFFYDIDTGEYCGKLGLGNYAHVGGVSYDKDHGILFVSDKKGKVMTLDFSNSLFINKLIEYIRLCKKDNKDIGLNSKEVDFSHLLLKNDIYIDNTDIKKASTMYYNNGKLYIATCNQTGGMGQVISLDISGVDNNRNVLYTKNNPEGYSIPGFTQGICVTNYEGVDYLLTTQSCDNAESVITVQNLKDGSKIGSFNLKQPGAESLTIDKDGKIICCFEYGKKRIFETTMKRLMDSLDS